MDQKCHFRGLGTKAAFPPEIPLWDNYRTRGVKPDNCHGTVEKDVITAKLFVCRISQSTIP